MPSTLINLSPDFFSEKEKVLVEHGPLSVSIFRYPSGVCALRLKNDQGLLLMLPFQGMQIWSAEFGGRNLTMKSMFSEPRPTRTYLENYGGFLLHCGATAMGVPSQGDTHPLHGELPNAPFERAYLVLGEQAGKPFIGVGGEYRHTVAFSFNYLAETMVQLEAGASLFKVSAAFTNLKQTPMEFMYLAHINFRPVDNSRLVYSARCTPETVRVRTSIPSHVRPGPGYVEFIQELKLHPERHHLLSPGLKFDPEIVFSINYQADSDGWAHSIQVHPDGSADYVAHRPQQLDKGVRWICRTPDQDALGLVLPATAEPEGYTAEKAKGNLKVIPAGGKYLCEMIVGALSPAQAKAMEEKINRMI